MNFNQKSVDSKVVLDEILNLIESVSEVFSSYSYFSLNGTTLGQVNTYKHLGITSSNRCSNDILT